MYLKIKLSTKKFAIMAFIIANFSSSIVASKKPQQNLFIWYGLEENFSNPKYRLYSDRELSNRVENPILTGRTKLHCARSTKEAQEALKHGADINAQDNNGLTPIQYMIMRNFTSVGIFLLEHKARISQDDKRVLYAQYKKYKKLYPTKF